MAAWRRAIELSLGETELEKLRMIARSRTEAASWVERARILLGYWENSSFFAVGQALGLHHQTVDRLERVEHGVHTQRLLPVSRPLARENIWDFALQVKLPNP